MTSDYIYIFCIPGSDSSRTCAPAPLQNNRPRSATVFPRTSAHIPQTNNNGNNNNNNSIPETTAAVGSSRPVNGPQSAVLDLPEDRAPLPARQRGGHAPSNRASFPGAGDNRWTQVDNDSRQPDAGVTATSTDQPSSLFEDSFQYEMCTVPSYTALRNRASDYAQDFSPSPFYALRWAPRATSSPVRQNRRSLCDSRAKACWRRMFNRECCLRCFVTVTTFRWLLLFFASIGAGCILSGVVLGILYVSLGTSFLVLSIMFMGMYSFLVLVYLFQLGMLISFFSKNRFFFDYRIWASHAIAITLYLGLLGLCNVLRSTPCAAYSAQAGRLSCWCSHGAGGTAGLSNLYSLLSTR